MSLPLHDSAPALIEPASGRSVTYGRLEELVWRGASAMPPAKGLVAVALSPTVEAVVAYLAARSAGHAVMVLDPAAGDAALQMVTQAYAPDVFYRQAGPPGPGYVPAGPPWLFRRSDPVEAPPVHADLALLLPTSGSTGSPKFVRLSETNIASNTAAIASSLGLTAGERAVTSLPLSYSYGLSVLNTHLHVGAAVVLTGASVIEPAFWDAVRQHRVTSLAGVPYTYRMLERVGFRSMDLPCLTKMTQAGGRLAEDLIVAFARTLAWRGGGLYVMYGQTEASPRMTCLPPDQLPARAGSVGRPLAGGRLQIRAAGGLSSTPGVEGEVVYRGPNVMMGYATGRTDLAEGDLLQGVLATGDVGYLDPDGYLWLTGRSKRIAKLFGARVSLDDVEALFEPCGPVAAVAGEDTVVVHHEQVDASILKRCRLSAAKALRVPPSAIETVAHPGGLPTNSNGKIDYRSLPAREAPR